MPEEKDQIKTIIVKDATDAAMKGIGTEFATDELRELITGYWEGRFEAQKEEILGGWENKREKALEKAEKIGEQTALIAKEEGAKAVTLSHFKAAIPMVNQEVNYSNWC